MKIAIDAGHGGSDPGAVGVGGRQEKHDALKMAQALATEMGRRGHQVIMTRTADVLPNPRYAARYNLANNQKADVFISLHRNSAGATATGSEVLYRTQSVKTAANNAKSKALAETLAGNIANATGFRNRGAKAQNKNTTVLQYTTMPAVTVEAGFVSHAPTADKTTGKISESDNARFERTMPAMISAIADGLEAHFGKGTATSAPKPAETSKPSASSVAIPAFFKSKGVLKVTKPYMRGEPTFFVQDGLIYHNALDPKDRDGIYGPKTEAAVKLFQAARQKEGRDIGAAAPDGKVGIKTATILAERRG